MKQRLKRVLSTVLCVACASICMTSCSDKTDNADNSNKLTYWVTLTANSTSQVSNYAETKIAQELEKRLGADIEYIHPANGQVKEKFNIMIAMDDRPDLIEYSWANYPGGPANAIDSNIIIDITPYLDMAPNFKKYLEEHEDIAKMVKTDDGRIIGFPFVRGDESLLTSAGIVLRSDWLKELNLNVPETIEEWETVLTAFKEQKGASVPLSIRPLEQLQFGAFVGAYGTTSKTYVEDGIVKYGPAQPEFKEFLTLMNKWYNKGLISPSIATLDSAETDANILSGVSGAAVGSIGSGIGRWMAAASEDGYDLVAAPYPVLNKGDKAQFGQCDIPVPGTFVCISSTCKNIELAMKYLDYGYSEEGQMLYNFGIEGESYNIEDGYPKYADVITKNPEGKSLAEAMANYIRAHESGPFIQDKRYMEQYAVLPQQQQAWKVWTDTDASKYILPHITTENADDIAKMQTAVNTYYEEMLYKFIMGIEPIDNFDKYVDELNNRGLATVVKSQQEGYDRYLAR
ncbi:MAG: extracellular solute-binding protein [Clostridia bacterium]|nr:extracellular solute-binding protein [Clostridia bacterium]